MGPNGPVALLLSSVTQGMEDFNVDADERREFSLIARKIANMVFNFQAEELNRRIQQQNKNRTR